MNKIIDCNQRPVFNDYSIVEHKELGEFEFDPEKLLYYQAVPNGIRPQKLRWQRAAFKQPEIKLANANIVLFLLNNVGLVPDAMKEENENGETAYFFFLGTIIAGCLGDEYVPYLHWNKKDNTLDCGQRNEECCVDQTDFVVVVK